MRSPLYIFENVTIKRKDHSLLLEPYSDIEHIIHPGQEIGKEVAQHLSDTDTDPMWLGTPLHVPIERIDSIHAYSGLRFNSVLVHFLASKKVPVHFYSYYGGYSSSLIPKEALPNGKVFLEQVHHISDYSKRLLLARELLSGAFYNMRHIMTYYHRRYPEAALEIEPLDLIRQDLLEAQSIEQLMGHEGKRRRIYYENMDKLLQHDLQLSERIYHPPRNPANALLSFLNSLLYTSILNEIHRTQLNPTLGFLHQAGRQRYPLAYDIAEIFRPIIVESEVLKLFRRKMLTKHDFEEKAEGCFLTQEGRYKATRAFEQRIKTTFMHDALGRNVSYRTAIRLECYKLIKHMLGDKLYVSFKIN